MIGSCRVNDPFEVLAESGRAVRVWANIQSAPHTFGEVRQIVKFTLGEFEIPREFQPFVFHPSEPEPVRTPAVKRILETVDTVFIEVCELRELRHDPYYFQVNHFYREFVSKYGAALLPWYRAFSLGEAITEELVAGALEKLSDRGPEERKFIEAVLRKTQLKPTTVEAALEAFKDIRFDDAKQWVLVSHFLVPGLGGTQMKDRAESIEMVRKVAAQNSVAMYDPSELLVRHGRQVALASEGRDIYHYHSDFNVTVANALLQTAGLITAPKGSAVKTSKSPSDLVLEATSRTNNMLIELHRMRVDQMGVDKSGLYAHYKGLLDDGRLADQQISSLANLIVNLLPRFDSYHVLRAGLGELALVLASAGRQVVGFDQNPGRFAAMTAGLEALCDSEPEAGRRFAVGRAAIPYVEKSNRTLAIAHHLIGYKPEQEEAVLDELGSYAAVLIDPRIFLFARKSQEEQEAMIETMRSRGFTQIREFPTLGVAYCAKPGAVAVEAAIEAAPTPIDDQDAAETAEPSSDAAESAPDTAVATPEAGRWTVMAPFEADGGQGWAYPLPHELGSATDTKEEPYRCLLRLFEDGEELGPGHARHDTIRNLGGGHYSLWAGTLYFSTSDGSDPNDNGRRYTLALAT